jgi:hypothetical protein
MIEPELIVAWLSTSEMDMQILDARRLVAEKTGTAAQTWQNLAQQYKAQGRPCQAASCQRRADYYNQTEAYA